MPKKPVIQPQDKYVLRLPDGLRDRIKAEAEAENRSMNAEIIAVLEKWYGSLRDDLRKDIEALDHAGEILSKRDKQLDELKGLVKKQNTMMREQNVMIDRLLKRLDEGG
jgi:hypothetical protein